LKSKDDEMLFSSDGRTNIDVPGLCSGKSFPLAIAISLIEGDLEWKGKGVSP
jgi:hypothetical protein